MSMSSIPAAPLPPKAVHVRQSPQTPLDLQHQLLYKMEQLRARSVPVAPLPPPPARLHRGIMLTDWALKDEIELAVRRMHLSHIPSAPPAPPAMRLDDNLVRSSKPLDKLIEKEAVHIHTRNQHSALSEPVVQKEFLAAANDMHKAMAEREVPLAPAAPAPVLNAVPPLHHTISEDAAEAAKEMSRAHYPPLAPAAPAPDLITKDAMLKKPLQAQILPAAIKTMQNVEQPVMIPDAPRPPSPFKMSRGNFMMARPFKDELGLTAKQYWMNKAQTKTKMMHEAHAEFVSAPVPRAVETTLVPPPLPPRPAESLAAMAAASTTNTTTMMPMMTSTPAVVVTTAMPAMHVLAGGEQGMLESEERMGLTEVAPMMPGEKEIVIDGLTRKEKRSHKKAAERLSPNVMPRSEETAAMTSSMSPNAANRGRRGSIGMKIKGAMKEVQGTLTRNPAKKEEGKMLLHGIDPATASTTNAGASSISNVSHA